MSQRIEFAIDSRYDGVGLVCRCANLLVADALGCEINGTFELGLAEAITNVIEHSYCEEPGNRIEVDLNLLEDRVEVEIRDTGIGMPPGLDLKRTLDFDPDDLDNLPEGGMGLFLIQNAMDGVDILRNGNTNCLRLTKRHDSLAAG